MFILDSDITSLFYQQNLNRQNMLPKNLLEQVHHFHITYERKTQSDVITVWWKPWWKRKSIFKFPRSIASIDNDNGLYTYEAVPEYYASRDQLYQAIAETFEDPDPRDDITTKKEGNVTYINRTET